MAVFGNGSFGRWRVEAGDPPVSANMLEFVWSLGIWQSAYEFAVRDVLVSSRVRGSSLAQSRSVGIGRSAR